MQADAGCGMAEVETVGRALERYSVTRTDDEEAPYELHGPRGAHYVLFRNLRNREMLFPVNLRGFTKSCPFNWLTDKDGRLEVVT